MQNLTNLEYDIIQAASLSRNKTAQDICEFVGCPPSEPSDAESFSRWFWALQEIESLDQAGLIRFDEGHGCWTATRAGMAAHDEEWEVV